MTFRHAWYELLNGKRVKLPSWTGYWMWEDNTIKMYCHDGSVLDIRETDNVAYTISNIISKDWQVVDEPDSSVNMP